LSTEERQRNGAAEGRDQLAADSWQRTESNWDLRKAAHEAMERLRQRLAASDGGMVNSSMDRNGK
jgi:hypothetical protein